MSIQQNMASDIYRMADSVHRSRDIAAFQQSLAQSIKSGAVESYVGIPVLQSLTQKLKLAQQKEAMAMAAPQGQQQQGVPLAAQVMQDAGQTDEDEQRYAGIDELRTNLPTEEDDQTVDDEYANGGIIAFADEGQVRDSNSDPLVERLREDDPEALQRLMRATQTNQTGPETPVITSATTGRNEGILLPRTPAYSSEPVDDKQYQDSIAIPPKAVSNWWDEHMAKIKKANEAAAAARGQPLTSPVFPKRISEAEGAQAEMLKAEAASPGVAGLPAAQNVKIEPDRQGAGGAGAGAGGERLTPKVGLENAPPTLAQAEALAGKSPAASQAVSMLDKYIAMLEKSGESVGREKKEAFYMALIQGGLGMMGGTSPNAFANISAGMLPATQAYQQAIAGIRKDDRARIEKLINAGLSKEKLGMELKKLGIEEKKVDALVNYYNARAGAAGSGGDAAGDRQLRLLAFNSGKELTRVEADVAKVRNSEEYKEAAGVLKRPFDPKSASPAIRAMRKSAEDTISKIDTDLNRRLDDARDTVNFYRKEAGFEPPNRTNSTVLPNGIPPGSRLAGKSGGKNVYAAPDGKQYIVD